MCYLPAQQLPNKIYFWSYAIMVIYIKSLTNACSIHSKDGEWEKKTNVEKEREGVRYSSRKSLGKIRDNKKKEMI